MGEYLIIFTSARALGASKHFGLIFINSIMTKIISNNNN